MLSLEELISDADLKSAIELLISRVFLAMSIANALAGSQTTDWRVARKFTAAQLFQEAVNRGLPLETFKGAVTENPITESVLYRQWVARTCKHPEVTLVGSEETGLRSAICGVCHVPLSRRPDGKGGYHYFVRKPEEQS